MDIEAYRRLIIAWGKDNFRAFPWRLTDNPYRILMAEVMLHRTQALQVLPTYERFISRYPDVPALAGATKEDLHTALFSLGLRWRVDLIQAMAVDLMERFRGEIPRDKADLLTLPGVSDYVASAVRCFAWNLPDAIIDTNSVRVVGRLYGLEIKDSSRRNPQFKNLIQMLVDPDQPRAYNYALLDHADRLCTKKRKPLCEQCPLTVFCVYYRRLSSLEEP
jgi:A/G-specific adenine glycosylase